jgi:hypothetical protein
MAISDETSTWLAKRATDSLAPDWLVVFHTELSHRDSFAISCATSIESLLNARGGHEQMKGRPSLVLRGAGQMPWEATYSTMIWPLGCPHSPM